MSFSLMKEIIHLLKITLPHFTICLISIGYIIAGGYIFTYLEKYQELSNSTNNIPKNHQIYRTMREDLPKELSLPKSIMLAFTIVTTVGYGDIVPRTSGGKIFCIFYGFVGIPLTLLALADIGQFLTSGVNRLDRRIKCSITKKDSGTKDDESDKSLSAFILLVLFIVYICMGAFVVQSWSEGKSFLDGVYFSFISLTSIGFGDIVPPEDHFSFTLFYVVIGLTLSTMAIDILSKYLKKLHYFGAVVKNCGNVRVRFGGKVITVKELINAIGRKLGASEEELEELCKNLDQLVCKVIEESKKRDKIKKTSIVPTIERQFEEFHGSVLPYFLKTIGEDKIGFIDDEGNTPR